MSKTAYLVKRHHTWHVVVEIPKPLRVLAGTPEHPRVRYTRSLETHDLDEANRLKLPHVMEFKRRIETLRKQQTDPDAELFGRALAFRDALERSRGRTFVDHRGADREEGEELLADIRDEAQHVLNAGRRDVAERFYRTATGTATYVRDLMPAWIDELERDPNGPTRQTINQHRDVIGKFLAWSGDSTVVEEVTRKKAGAYGALLIGEGSPISHKTAKRYLSSLSSFWKWIASRDDNTTNVWLGHSIGRKKRSGAARVTRRQWSDDDIVTLLTGKFTPKYEPILHDLVRLALVTGARLDELCAPKRSDVEKHPDGYWLTIGSGKTESAIRTIPLHPSVTPIIERRLREGDEHLFAGLTPGGPDKKRSWLVSLRFGEYRKSLGLGTKGQDFHALRYTFMDMMEAQEVPESTTKLLVGHARGSMTYGLYSKGERLNLRGVIEKLQYAPEIMRLIRQG